MNLCLWHKGAGNELINRYIPDWKLIPTVSHNLTPSGQDETDWPLWRRTGPEAFREKIELEVPYGWDKLVQLNVSEGLFVALNTPGHPNREKAFWLVMEMLEIFYDVRPNAKVANYATGCKWKLNPQHKLDHVGMARQVEDIANADKYAVALKLLSGLCSSIYDNYDPSQEWMVDAQLARVIYNPRLLAALDPTRSKPWVFTVHARYTNSGPTIHKPIPYREMAEETIRPLIEELRSLGALKNSWISLWGAGVTPYYLQANVAGHETARRNVREELEAEGFTWDPSNHHGFSGGGDLNHHFQDHALRMAAFIWNELRRLGV